jgi:hypothetical protein
MYSVATLSLGRATQIGFMTPLSRIMLWVAVGSWVWSPPRSRPVPSRRGAGGSSVGQGRYAHRPHLSGDLGFLSSTCPPPPGG